MPDEIRQKIEAFFSGYKKQTYKKGEILLRAGEDPTGIVYLKEGIVKEYAVSKNGEEVVMNVFKSRSFFPMSWAINNTPNAYYFEAMSDLEVWKASRNDVLEFVKRDTTVLYDLLSRVYRGTDGLLMRMTYLMSGSAYLRLITELVIYAKRFKQNEQENIEVAISETDLAALTGMTRETISREMKTLKAKGLILTKNHLFVITNLQKLQEEL